MENLILLSRTEMKNIKGGGVCRVYGSNGWSDCDFSPEEADGWYEDFAEDITGYCCASCGQEPFENAEPCY